MALDSLYLEKILAHYREPRNEGVLEPCDGRGHVRNEVCGDEVTVTLRKSGARLTEVRFEAKGCAICVASASMMTDLLEGRTMEDAERTAGVFRRFMELGDAPEKGEDSWGDLLALDGVRQYPPRIRCATLAWEALQKALPEEAD